MQQLDTLCAIAGCNKPRMGRLYFCEEHILEDAAVITGEQIADEVIRRNRFEAEVRRNAVELAQPDPMPTRRPLQSLLRLLLALALLCAVGWEAGKLLVQR